MSEEEARQKLQAIWNARLVRLPYSQESQYKDSRGNVSFVNHHIEKIYEIGNGKWSNAKADEYVAFIAAEMA